MGYARQECIVQSQLKHENIVELYDYTESEKEIVLLMEYCNSANYFEEKLEEVSIQYKAASARDRSIFIYADK